MNYIYSHTGIYAFRGQRDFIIGGISHGKWIIMLLASKCHTLIIRKDLVIFLNK